MRDGYYALNERSQLSATRDQANQRAASEQPRRLPPFPLYTSQSDANSSMLTYPTSGASGSGANHSAQATGASGTTATESSGYRPFLLSTTPSIPAEPTTSVINQQLARPSEPVATLSSSRAPALTIFGSPSRTTGSNAATTSSSELSYYSDCLRLLPL